MNNCFSNFPLYTPDRSCKAYPCQLPSAARNRENAWGKSNEHRCPVDFRSVRFSWHSCLQFFIVFLSFLFSYFRPASLTNADKPVHFLPSMSARSAPVCGEAGILKCFGGYSAPGRFPGGSVLFSGKRKVYGTVLRGFHGHNETEAPAPDGAAQRSSPVPGAFLKARKRQRIHSNGCRHFRPPGLRQSRPAFGKWAMYQPGGVHGDADQQA